MGRDSIYLSPDGDHHKGKIVLSKCAVAAWVVVTVLVIVAVGLLAGLLGKPAAVSSGSDDDSKPTIAASTVPGTSGVLTSAATSTPDPSLPWNNIRLPGNLKPSHYVVDLQPNLKPIRPDYYMFNGSSSVTFEVMKSTPYIIIHSNKLNYSTIEVVDHNAVGQDITKTWQVEDNQYLVVQMNSNLIENEKYTLNTWFEGELAEDLGGIYRSTYENAEGKQIVIATSQMQPTDARKAFPCFDEPALKATFDISLWHESPNFALSNMPNISTRLMYDDWWKTTFNRTEIMSTYLLAFVVCDFDYVGSMTQDEVQTRIYARPQQIANGNGDYAKDITPVIIDYFENYFNVSYPLPKSDQIAVPDFAAGAMENWGLVIYRETALLFDPKINSPSNQQRVAVVVAHELAHQWFGNLISPTWWDELWLNEGFASYVEYIGTNVVEPDWGMLNQFVVNDLHSAMLVDGLTSSRPIVPDEVNTPADINALFDTISYNKGACIIRMINELAGQDAFVLGLKRYLDANAYGSVDHNQLFEFWEKAINDVNAGANPTNGFKQAMDTWILQMGYPVVNMMRTDSTETVVITQDRFLIDPNATKTEPPSDFNYKWNVPLWYVSQSSVPKTFRWFLSDKSQDEIMIPVGEYFIGNYEAFGYYRVNYDTENWNRITQQLIDDHTMIDVRSRGQLIDDAFSLARAEIIPYKIALDLTEFLRQDHEYVPWESALDVMAYFDVVLGRSYVYGPYSDYMLYLVEPLYNNVSWVDDGGHLEKFQRVNALSAACNYGYEDCVLNATEQYSMWMKDSSTNAITPNLKNIVYCNGIRYGGAEEWDFAWKKYQEETNSQEKAKLQYALTCTRTPWIIRRFLDQWILNNSFVRAQDASGVLEDLCLNEYARDMTWDFLRANWDYIYQVYGTGFFSFSGIIESCTSRFSTEFELQELENFKKANEDQLGSGRRSVEQAIELTNTNINWRKNHEDEVYAWLREKLDNLGL